MRDEADQRRSIAMTKYWEKWHCERQALMNVGFTPMTRAQIKKWRYSRPVELTLTRKDAHLLHYVFATMKTHRSSLYLANDYEPFTRRLLNKLKRQGIK